MATLLGSKFCIESLHNDVSDLQSAVLDVFSRAGPVQLPSWKYPDKMAANLDVAEMLETYKYSEDGDEEERQMAHIILMELVIDRLVLLLQSMARYLEQTLAAGRAVSGQQKTNNTSIGLVVKKYWNKMVHVHRVVQQLQSENKSLKRKIADLENSVVQLKQDVDTMKSTTNGLSSVPGSNANVNGNPPSLEGCQTLNIGRDEYNKATQTLETAFVPCESCFRVQENLKELGNTVTDICLSQGLPSSLARYRAQVEGLDWFTANDVTRWTVEQNKDLSRLGKHMEQLMATIDPLKADVVKEQNQNKELQGKLTETKKDLKLERETQRTQLKQYEAKLVDIKKQGEESVKKVNGQKEDIIKAKKEMEGQLQEVKKELEQQKDLLKAMESAKADLMKELKEAITNNVQVQTLEAEMSSMRSQLDQVTTQLKEATVDLNKERAKNKNINKHSEALQDKQGAMVSRLDTLDLENESLRCKVTELEESQEKLQDSLERAHEDKHRLQRNVKEEQALVKQITSEKDKLEESIREMEDTVASLEKQVSDAKEQLRLIVEYPDLNGPVNPDLKGTGDIAVDMENQISANSVRIKLLESQNAKLRRSITKMLQAQPRLKSENKPPLAPLPLWHPNSATTVARNGMSSPYSSGSDTDHEPHPPPLPPSPDTQAYSYSSKPRNLKPLIHDKPLNLDSEDSNKDMFLVSQSPVKSTNGRKIQTRPVSGKKKGKTDKPTSAPNTSSIAAYLKLKRAGMLKDPVPNQQRPVSGKSIPPDEVGEYQAQDVFICQKCDKMYNSMRDLEVHKSYCFGGI